MYSLTDFEIYGLKYKYGRLLEFLPTSGFDVAQRLRGTDNFSVPITPSHYTLVEFTRASVRFDFTSIQKQRRSRERI